LLERRSAEPIGSGTVTLGAALAWQERTGGDISHLFAQPAPAAEHAA
jgi:hypothetical protein